MNLNKYITKIDIMMFKYHQVLYGLRISVAFIFTLFLMKYFKFPDVSWVLITLIVVMGPISYFGNVLSRAKHRIIGTLLGAISGWGAIFIEQWSIIYMYVWCGIVIFLSSYLILGKRPYVGLLVNITLAVIVGSENYNTDIVLFRSVDIIVGCVLAVLFCALYSQRAFIHWRINIGKILDGFSIVYNTSTSQNLLEKPNIGKYQESMVDKIIILRSLVYPSIKESKLNNKLFEAIQFQLRNILYLVNLINTSYWCDHNSHLNIIYSIPINEYKKNISKEFEILSNLMITGNPGCDFYNRDTLSTMLKMEFDVHDISHTSMNIYLWLNVELTKELITLRKLMLYSLIFSKS